MGRIITVSREFGSGGRELAKRLADSLNIEYVDSEIVSAIAKETDFDEAYINGVLESGIKQYPLTIARSFFAISPINNSVMLVAKQHRIIKDIASKKDCIIVGRGADAVLADLHPFRIFVYADMPSKIERCKSRTSNGEQLTDKEIEKQIKRIDKNRKATHDLYAPYEWGDKVGYDLCINTANITIKDIIPALTELINGYFREREQ